MPRLLPWLLLVAVLCAHRPAAAAPPRAGYRSSPRKPGPYLRDLRRVERLRGYRPPAGSRLTARLYQPADFQPVGGDPWQRRLRVPLGSSITLELETRYVPGDRASHVTRLELVKPGRRRSLIPAGVSVRLSDQNSFAWYNNAVLWKGPRSRMELLKLFHELGHAHSFGNRSAAQQEHYTVQLSKLFGPELTPAAQTFNVGEERFAWAQALRTMRQLRREGFDLFAGIPRRQIMSEIYSQRALGSYYLQGGAERVNPLIRELAR